MELRLQREAQQMNMYLGGNLLKHVTMCPNASQLMRKRTRKQISEYAVISQLIETS